MTNNDHNGSVQIKADLEWEDISVHTTEMIWTDSHEVGDIPDSIDATAYLTLKQAKKLRRELGKAIRTLEDNSRKAELA